MKKSDLYELRSMLWIIISILFLILHHHQPTIIGGILYEWCLIDGFIWAYRAYKQKKEEK